MEPFINECACAQSSDILSIVGIAVAVCAFIFPLFFNWRYRQRDKMDDLTNRLDTIINLGIEHPYLEDYNFTSKWNEFKSSGDEKYLRYDNYCNILYNYLHSVCEHYNYNKDKIEKYIEIKSWIRKHKDNWENPIEPFENVDGYDKKFRDLINSYLK
ncbi:MAG: hypothetical protein IJR06_03600 [Paludibacteraceae bacterium]|nr:hypothetical protein [Paludibacteraceae bacterium]